MPMAMEVMQVRKKRKKMPLLVVITKKYARRF
jgi:hypothetical protein